MLTVVSSRPKKDGEGVSSVESKTVIEEECEDLEDDAPPDDRAKLQEAPVFHTCDTTLNLVTTSFGGMLTSLSEQGLSHLLAGARGSVGIKSGRYMFEVTIVECFAQADGVVAISRAVPKSYLRVGFSPSGSMPVLGEHMECAYFDSEGSSVFNTPASKRKKPGGAKLCSGDTLGVVLSVGSASSKISLYRNGVLSASLRDLPEGLIARHLFPTISFKGMVLHVNFGPTTRVPLPFRCRMLQDAALEDVVSSTTKASASEKATAIFPVCLPDEGSFDWLDMFLESNPQFAEISDRKLQEWASRSGYSRPDRGKKSNDKPGTIDDGSAKKVLLTSAIMQKRDLVIMELKGNFVRADRELALKQFRLPDFNKVAKVIVGDPPASFKDRMTKVNLAIKQERLDQDFQKAKEARERERLTKKALQEAAAKRKRAAETLQARALEQKKRKLEELAEKKRKLDELMKSATQDSEVKQEEKVDNEEAVKEESQVKDDQVKDEAVKEESQIKSEEDIEMKDEIKEDQEDCATKDEIKTDDQDEDEAMEPPPVAELTAEEQKQWSRLDSIADMDPTTLVESYLDFTLPMQEEGFDEIQYEWLDSAETVEQYLEAWKRKFKSSVRIENLEPSDWFKERVKMWTVNCMIWKRKAEEYAKLRSLQKRQESTESGEYLLGDIKILGGKSVDDIVENLFKRESLNVFKLQDISNIGISDLEEPLFGNFTPEDWMLATLRFEVWLLVESYKRDCNDPEQKGVPLEHFRFYFTRYFKRPFEPSAYAMETVEEVLSLIRDCIVVDPSAKCACSLFFKEIPQSNDIFIKLTEASRIERDMRLASGDASAALKFSAKASTAPVIVPVSSGGLPENTGGLPLARKLRELVMPVGAQFPKPNIADPKKGVGIVGATSISPSLSNVQQQAAAILKAKLEAKAGTALPGITANMMPQLAAMLAKAPGMSPARPAAGPWAVMAQLLQAKAAANTPVPKGVQAKASASARP